MEYLLQPHRQQSCFVCRMAIGETQGDKPVILYVRVVVVKRPFRKRPVIEEYRQIVLLFESVNID